MTMEELEEFCFGFFYVGLALPFCINCMGILWMYNSSSWFYISFLVWKKWESLFVDMVQCQNDADSGDHLDLHTMRPFSLCIPRKGDLQSHTSSPRGKSSTFVGRTMVHESRREKRNDSQILDIAL